MRKRCRRRVWSTNINPIAHAIAGACITDPSSLNELRLGELQWCYMAEDMKKKENQEAKDMLMTMASFLYWHTLNYMEQK